MINLTKYIHKLSKHSHAYKHNTIKIFMADAIISVVAERLVTLVAEQIGNEVKLVRGVEKEVLDLSYKLKKVRNVLDDADRRGFRDKSIKQWLKRLEGASYEMDDVLDEWNISLLKLQMEQRGRSSEAPPKHKACPFIPYSSCLCFKKVATRRDIALKIKDVKEKLDVILEEEKQFSFLKNQGADSSTRLERVTTSSVEVAEMKGRDEEMDRLVSKLITDGASTGQQLGPIQMTSIVGAGGIGKTTLAQLVYNDSRVKDCFPLRIWICVSDPFDEGKIAKDIVEQVQESRPETNQLEMLFKCVEESVSGKKFLLVLDDVWTEKESDWGRLKNSLKHGEVGSSVLVTTRKERVAIMMGIVEEKMHRLGLLSDEYCWEILRNRAFLGRNEENLERFQDIGRKIANKCRGLPLAAKVLGSLLRFKNSLEAWENVLSCAETWRFEEAKEGIFPHLALSYNDLPPAQKRCFSYCAVFPKDHDIEVDKLIRNWIALGYVSSNGNLEGDLEVRGREYFDNLAMRSLLQDFDTDYLTGEITGCKMHDIVHDFCQFLREGDDLNRSSGGGVEATVLKKTSGTCEVCDPSSVSRIKEYRSLFIQEKLHSLHICDCRTSLRVLSLKGCGLQGVPTEIEKLIHLRDLDLSKNKLSVEHLKSICKIYNLQNLLLERCDLQEIPTEIGNLTQLRELDLSFNNSITKLPDSICDLHELRELNVSLCKGLSELPKGIDNLKNLKGLYNSGTSVKQYPQGFADLTGLQDLSKFHAGGDRSSFGLLKKLNRLRGYLALDIKLEDLNEGVVRDVREAELVKKIHLQYLNISFGGATYKKEEPLCIDVLDALQPHSSLPELRIANFQGSKLPSWIVSPHNQLREITIRNSAYCSSLPPFGILQCLEELDIVDMPALEIVGREFWGITSSSSGTMVGFPKLKRLEFVRCANLKEWEDITAEEEESATFSVLPCLKYLEVYECPLLEMLPHRVLRKASLLEELNLRFSTQLIERYVDQEDPLRILRSHIPNLTELTWE